MYRSESRLSFSFRAVIVSVVVGLICAITLGLGSPLVADSLGDKVDDARIKARAGKVEDALADLDKLASQFPDDVRVHFYRAKFLLDLDRTNAAADALENAVAALKKYEAKGGKSPDIRDLKPSILKDSKNLLKYRVKVRKLLRDYRTKSLPLIRKLIAEGRPLEASYVLDELSAALGEEDDELAKLSETIELAIAKSDEGE